MERGYAEVDSHNRLHTIICLLLFQLSWYPAVSIGKRTVVQDLVVGEDDGLFEASTLSRITDSAPVAVSARKAFSGNIAETPKALCGPPSSRHRFKLSDSLIAL